MLYTAVFLVSDRTMPSIKGEKKLELLAKLEVDIRGYTVSSQYIYKPTKHIPLKRNPPMSALILK